MGPVVPGTNKSSRNSMDVSTFRKPLQQRLPEKYFVILCIPYLKTHKYYAMFCSYFNMVIRYYNKQDKKSKHKKPHWSLKCRGRALE